MSLNYEDLSIEKFFTFDIDLKRRRFKPPYCWEDSEVEYIDGKEYALEREFDNTLAKSYESANRRLTNFIDFWKISLEKIREYDKEYSEKETYKNSLECEMSETLDFLRNLKEI